MVIPVHWLSRGDLRLGLAPLLGGRLLSVRYRGAELLWRNPELLDDDLRPADPPVRRRAAGELSG